MNEIRLISDKDTMFETAMKLYGESFPLHEQRLPSSQRSILSQEEYHFDLLYDRDLFIGILLYWETKAFIYVEHFCVDPSLRGQNYGTKALGLLEKKDKKIILEIDPPVDEVAIRRKGFYQRAGYVSNAFPHVHPPYRVGYEGHKLMVMSFGGALTEAEYAEFSSYLNQAVMGQ